jgi:exopolysaccharide biosynthesis protein
MEYVARTTSAFLAESGADIAINASYFLPFAGGSPRGDDYYPRAGQPASASGAVIAGGRRVSPVETDLDLRVNAMLCFRRAEARIVDGQVCPKGTSDGVAAGPRILAVGQQSDFMPFDNNAAQTRQPRTAFGLSADRRKAWIIVVDGRQAGYSLGASLPELADLFRTLGASDAINLDGGGSTTLAVRGADGRPALLNSPIHTGVPGRERPVANHIAIFLGTSEGR